MTGRNERCPCGSGRKFKACCLNRPRPQMISQAPPVEVIAKGVLEIQRKVRAQQDWKRRYGQILPVISTNLLGRRIVGAGSNLYQDSDQHPWKYIPDFLYDYVPGLFGTAWGQDELAKPENEWHPVVRWRVETLRYLQRHRRRPDNTYDVKPNGLMAAYLALAFNLFAIECNSRFDDDLLARLKDKQQFQGARHEVFVEATCLRAGFAIEHENERDRTKRHAEFTARHKATGQLLSVEAKSKHREGVLGQRGTPKPHEKLSLRFGKLLNDAIAKHPPYPLVVFIDTNLPYGSAERLLGRDPSDPSKPSRIMRELVARDRKEHGGVDRYAMLVFTNHPHHYAEPDELDPQKHTLSVQSLAPAKPLVHTSALDDLRGAVALYGNVPDEFPPQQ
jgi:hypothetical protein